MAALARGGDAWAEEEARARAEVERALRQRRSVVVATSREVLQVLALPLPTLPCCPPLLLTPWWPPREV